MNRQRSYDVCVYIYTHMNTYNETLPHHKKKECNFTICSNIDGLGGY